MWVGWCLSNVRAASAARNVMLAIRWREEHSRRTTSRFENLASRAAGVLRSGRRDPTKNETEAAERLGDGLREVIAPDGRRRLIGSWSRVADLRRDEDPRQPRQVDAASSAL